MTFTTSPFGSSTGGGAGCPAAGRTAFSFVRYPNASGLFIDRDRLRMRSGLQIGDLYISFTVDDGGRSGTAIRNIDQVLCRIEPESQSTGSGIDRLDQLAVKRQHRQRTRILIGDKQPFAFRRNCGLSIAANYRSPPQLQSYPPTAI